MHIVITGANGFVGAALARRIAADGRLGERQVTRLTLLDIGFGEGIPASGIVVCCQGDIADAAWLRSAVAERPIDVLFHLASIPGGTAEQNYDLARRVNLDATLQLLELSKAQVDSGGPPTRFVFASSIAVFGALPESVADDTPLAPLMTYGAQKVIGEVLVSDFSRRGWIQGLSLRLPGVLARPPAPTGQLSAFMSDIIRELAAGRPFTCPTSRDATTWASSLPCVVESLMFGATLDSSRLTVRRTLTLPTLRFSMGELVEAIDEVHRSGARDLVRYVPNERIEALFGRFPPLETARADEVGFMHDGQLTELVRRALQQI